MRRGQRRAAYWAAGLVSLAVTALLAGLAGYGVGKAKSDREASVNQRLDALERKLDSALVGLTQAVHPSGSPTPHSEGWRVRVFAPPSPANNLDGLRNANDAGSFVHTGSWMDLEEHQEHDGIFLPADAAFHVQGLFIPSQSGDYIFAMHMRLGGRDDQGKATSVACHVNLRVADSSAIAAGKLLANGAVEKAALVAEKPVALFAGRPGLVDAVVACDLPRGMSGKDVSIRICVRHKSEPSYRPVPAHLPAA